MWIRSPRLLPGGLTAQRIWVDVDPAELARGIAVEMEHTSDPALAREIAIDHLIELRDYYTRLAVMEGPGLGAGGLHAGVVSTILLLVVGIAVVAIQAYARR